MSGRKNMGILFGFVLAVSLIVSAATSALMINYCGRAQYQMLGSICGSIVKDQPGAEQTVLAVLKNHKSNLTGMSGEGAVGEKDRKSVV